MSGGALSSHAADDDDVNAICVCLLWWSQHRPTPLSHALAHTPTDTPAHISAMLLYEPLYAPLHVPVYIYISSSLPMPLLHPCKRASLQSAGRWPLSANVHRTVQRIWGSFECWSADWPNDHLGLSKSPKT